MKTCLLLISFMITGMPITRGQTFQLDNPASTLLINGSSSLHDWEMVATKISGTIEVSTADLEIKTIHSLSMSVDAKSLDGGKKGMNKDAFEALKAGTYENITFEFLELQEINCSPEVCQLNLRGNLTVAGTSRIIEVTCDADLSENKIKLSGRKALKMTDFNVKPPKAFLGLLKADDDVTVEFELEFEENQSVSP